MVQYGMTKKITAGVIISLLAITTTWSVGDRIAHFKAKPSENLGDAMQHLREFNQQLAVLLEQESLRPDDMVEIHRLTYTLENALERLLTETKNLAEMLEEVHLGSETMDIERVRENGSSYLKLAAFLTANP